ncbi:hypothetical protein RA280_30120 [Cupriavidus sp. CV2]|uniref:hypothetical protein n=1 Tax=Cupriavidus ulmosensis TaxID=3065913 RepID=UPI00296AA602|nr:hypothetical protein [Cupriavidus sp. CV2]MDW3685921.1 hypothetical protein [Cupriavidus sp. CV2]
MKRTRNLPLVLVAVALGGCVWAPGDSRPGRYDQGSGYRQEGRGDQRTERGDQRERRDDQDKRGGDQRSY